jgi:sterol desaturase/sphingolipid hydroxylase (fatty acid hydroxylase superfamily)
MQSVKSKAPSQPSANDRNMKPSGASILLAIFLRLAKVLAHMGPSLIHHFELYQSYIPFDLLDPYNFLISVLVLTFIINFRYFLLVLPFWLHFYKRASAPGQKNFLYKKLPSASEQAFEIRWSLVSSLIFAMAGVGMGVCWQMGLSQIYLPIDQNRGWLGLVYLPVSALLVAILHDFYFYWVHRALHHKSLYARFHKIHHMSLQPSPWASFSFHPVESVLNAVFLPVVVLILPLHPLILLFHLTLMTVSAIINHLGFELYPSSWGGHIVGAYHHSEHHRVFRSNYGLFFTWWDRICKTETNNYRENLQKMVRGSS